MGESPNDHTQQPPERGRERHEPQPGSPKQRPREKPASGAVAQSATAVARHTTAFSKELVATLISLASAAFGVVAALAWNSAITKVFETYFKNGGQISALFIYALIVTLIGVLVIVLLARLATRLDAEPVAFAYPGTPKKQSPAQ